MATPEIDFSIESSDPSFGLVEKRQMLHKRLGELAQQEADIYIERASLTKELIGLNRSLRESGVDTRELSRQLYVVSESES